MAPDPAEELSLWRYHLIAEALDRRIGSKERGLIVRRLAGEEHVGPDGQPHTVSRNTLDRWIRAYRQHFWLPGAFGWGTQGPTRTSAIQRSLGSAAS